ncbi:hypothetical protein, partial [Thiolapillus sp.]
MNPTENIGIWGQKAREISKQLGHGIDRLYGDKRKNEVWNDTTTMARGRTVIPETKELFSSHIPALQVLMSMGYTYLPPEAAMKQRGGNTGEVLLRNILIGELRKRRFSWKGKQYPISNNAIDEIVR